MVGRLNTSLISCGYSEPSTRGDRRPTRILSREDLSARRCPAGFDVKSGGRNNSVKQKEATESRTPESKTAKETSLMNSSLPHRIPTVLSSLECLEDLSLHDQSVFLLKRLALRFPRGKTFWLDVLYLPYSFSVPDPDELAPGPPN
jgi:hypothetical protein